MKERPRSGYWTWVEGEGIPLVEGYGVRDIRTVELAPWGRMGGKGAFVHLYGMEGVTGLYLLEIPPGGAIEPEKHMFEEVFCALNGQGITEVWQENGSKQMFEWGQGSVFAPPLNCWHRLINGTNQPVRLMAVTNAPLVMDIFHNPEFIFNSDFQFRDRYSGENGYFQVGDKRFVSESGCSNLWETNFIPDVERAMVDAQEMKGAGVKITQFEMSGNALIGHMADWPAYRYHKAHYHGPGAVLLILRSEGYVLIWPKEAGVRPYENGREDEVVEFHWGPGSIYCPPSGWFHQHFNTGAEPARQLAVRYNSHRVPIEFKIASQRREDGVMIPIREGGTLIDYEDEDPEIRKRFDAALAAKGLTSAMPPVTYRLDPVAF
ncbi:MAG TPA: cupin domain-containing protein [Chloroflexota bacterium]|nr:cupin domain-containing protein [Chloroflexota bacterium]